MAYGSVKMRRLGSVMELISVVSSSNACSTTTYPLSFEDLDHPFGYILYSSYVPAGQNLSVPGIRDHGYVVLDGHYKASSNIPPSFLDALFKITKENIEPIVLL